MAKKIILKDLDNVVILPITRGELVVDSSGNQALHSREFLATDSQPGLTSLHFVEISSNSTPEINNPTTIQLKSSSDSVYPITTAEAVMVTTNNKTESLANVLKEMQNSPENSNLILDERPTEGNTTHAVSSDGVFQELKETVGNIQILLQHV